MITTPKTPLPGSIIWETGDFSPHIQYLRRLYLSGCQTPSLTRYRYNDVPCDTNGKYFYIKDGDCIWNPGWQPTKTDLDFYECCHGLGYSRFTGKKKNLQASCLFFIPLEDNCEIQWLHLKNDGDAPKTFSLFSYVEWCLWNADDDMKNFQRNLSIGESRLKIRSSTIRS